jgi:hypothetical protein
MAQMTRAPLYAHEGRLQRTGSTKSPPYPEQVNSSLPQISVRHASTGAQSINTDLTTFI